VGFELAIIGSETPQSYALDFAATGTVPRINYCWYYTRPFDTAVFKKHVKSVQIINNYEILRTEIKFLGSEGYGRFEMPPSLLKKHRLPLMHFA